MTTTLIEGKDGRLYSDAFLAEIRELNQTLFKTVRATLEKTPFADCRQTLKDYVRLYEETEARFGHGGAVSKPSQPTSAPTGPPPAKRAFGYENQSNGTDSGFLSSASMAKNVKFAPPPELKGLAAAAAVVIKEEDETEDDESQDAVKQQLASENASKFPTFQFNIPNSKESDSSSQANNAPLHRATGTSSLLAPLPLAFNFKPSNAQSSDNTAPSNAGGLTPLPLMNLFPPKSTASDSSTSTFSFGTASSAPTSAATGIFGAPPAAIPSQTPFGGFSFGAGPFGSGAATSAGAEKEEGEEGGDDEEDSPPEPETVEVKEEGAFYQKPVLLYFKDKGALKEKGAGVLFLKRIDKGVQLLVRATNALRSVLLNSLLSDKLPLTKHGKQSVRFATMQTGSDEKPALVEYFFKCDNASEAEELFEKLQKERNVKS